MAKLVAKQKVEMEALAQRGVRGKSELELRRATETERRMFRFRNIVMVRKQEGIAGSRGAACRFTGL